MIFEKADILKKGVKTFAVEKDLLFVIYEEYLECIELTTFKTIFQIDESVSEIAIIRTYLLFQKEISGEIYIYNLEGVFLKKTMGKFLLYKRVCFDDKAFFPVKIKGQGLGDRFWCLFDVKNIDVEIGPNIPIPGFNLVYEGIGVHVGIPSQFIKAFNITTGAVVWEHSVKSIFNIPIEKSFHPKVSFHYPIHFKGMIIISAQPNELIALDVLTGELAWRTKDIYITPLIEYNEEIFIVNPNSAYKILDAKNGVEKKCISNWTDNQKYPGLKKIDTKHSRIKVYENFIQTQVSVESEIFFLSKNTAEVLAYLKIKVPEGAAIGKVEYANERLIVQSGSGNLNQGGLLHFYKVFGKENV